MYVNPFWLGVLCTVVAEFLLLIGWVIIGFIKNK